VDTEELNKRFEEFVRSIEDGDVITDAILVYSSLTSEQLDNETTTYQQICLGKASIHRCVGLLEIAKDEMLRQED
jgi:hypothetical protein